jgi:hypothetical protein
MAYDFKTDEQEEEELNPSTPATPTNPFRAVAELPTDPKSTEPRATAGPAVRPGARDMSGFLDRLKGGPVSSGVTRELRSLPQAPQLNRGSVLTPATSSPIKSLGSATSPIVKTGEAPQQTGGQGSGSFTNLNAYLDANKSLGFGQQVAGRVQSEVDRANQAQDQADSGFRGLSDKGTVLRDDNVIRQVETDPTKLANDEALFGQWTRQRDAKYGGPSNLVDTEFYNPAQTATAKARATSDQTQDEGGRKAYLQQEYGSGSKTAPRFDYSAGQQKLDNLLIQNDAGSKEAFQNVQKNAAASSDRFQTLNDALAKYAGQNAQVTADTRKASRDFIGIDDANNYQQGKGVIGADESKLDSDVARRRAELAEVKAKLANLGTYTNVNQFTADQKAMTKVDPSKFTGFNVAPRNMGSYDPYYAAGRQDGGDLYRINAGNYASFANEADLNRSSVASTEQLARMQALSKLAGIDQTFISDPSKAGSYTQGALYNYDPNKLSSDVAGQRNQLTSRLDKILNAPSGGIQSMDWLLANANRERNNFGLSSVNKNLEGGPNRSGNPAGINPAGAPPAYIPPEDNPSGDPVVLPPTRPPEVVIRPEPRPPVTGGQEPIFRNVPMPVEDPTPRNVVPAPSPEPERYTPPPPTYVSPPVYGGGPGDPGYNGGGPPAVVLPPAKKPGTRISGPVRGAR